MTYTERVTLLAEVLEAETELNDAQIVLLRKRNSLIGRLPFVRRILDDQLLNLHLRRVNLENAKTYLKATIEKS